mgnify:CR=1 FL=1
MSSDSPKRQYRRKPDVPADYAEIEKKLIAEGLIKDRVKEIEVEVELDPPPAEESQAEAERGYVVVHTCPFYKLEVVEVCFAFAQKQCAKCMMKMSFKRAKSRA